MLRRLLHINSRVGMPGTLLNLGDAGGRVLYLGSAMGPVSVVVGLEHDDVLQLHEATGTWLREQAEREEPAPFGRPAPLVAGSILRGFRDAVLADADRLDRPATLQLRTVPDPS